jgi:hypothetical protein
VTNSDAYDNHVDDHLYFVEHETKTVKTSQNRDYLTANTLQSATLCLDIRAVDIDVARDGGLQSSSFIMAKQPCTLDSCIAVLAATRLRRFHYPP